MYNFRKTEKKWQDYWEENKTFKTDTKDFSKPKYYVILFLIKNKRQYI